MKTLWARIILLFLFVAKIQATELKLPKKVNCISQSEGRIVAASDDNDVYFFIEDIQNVQKLISKNVSEIKFYDEKNTIFTAMTEKGEYSVWKIIEDENKNLTCEIIFSADCSVKGKSIEKLSFTADTSYIALGLSDNSIRLHYRLRFTNSAITKIFPSKNSKITSLNFSNNNNFLISTYANGELFLWDCITGKEIAHINNLEPKNFFPSFFNEETKTIIKFNRKNELCFYDLSGKVIFKQKIEKSIKTITSPTKSGEICCITDKNEIILIDINTGKITGQAEHSETKKITAVSYHENNSVVFAGFEDGSIKN